jgi:hypothetical protein
VLAVVQERFRTFGSEIFSESLKHDDASETSPERRDRVPKLSLSSLH